MCYVNILYIIFIIKGFNVDIKYCISVKYEMYNKAFPGAVLKVILTTE